MRRGSPAPRATRCLAALWLAAAAIGAGAKELSVHDAGNRLGRLSLAVKAEKVVHQRKPYLLLRLQATGIRYVERPDGSFDSVSLAGRTFLPVRVDCDAIRVAGGGKTFNPERLSLCRGESTLRASQAMPLFVVFPYPEPGSATVTIPVTVLEPEAPVAVSIRQAREAAATAARVPATEKLLGDHVLSVGLLVP